MVLKMAIYRFVGRIFYIPQMLTYSLFQGSFRFPDVYSAVTLYTYYSVDDIVLYHTLEAKTKKKKGERVPLVVTFSKQLPDISNILRKHHGILSNSAKLRAAFTQPPIVAYRRDANICDTLIHMKTNRILKKEKLCSCKVCEKIVRSEVMSAAGEDAHKVETTACCTDRNIIYGIVCVKCDRAI